MRDRVPTAKTARGGVAHHCKAVLLLEKGFPSHNDRDACHNDREHARDQQIFHDFLHSDAPRRFRGCTERWDRKRLKACVFSPSSKHFLPNLCRQKPRNLAAILF
jgi:hypothetical protein